MSGILVRRRSSGHRAGGGGGGGGLNGFTGKYTFTIDHTQCGSVDSTDFPVTVRETRAALKSTGNGGSVTDSAGDDIVFCSDSGLTTPLDYELERWVAATGELIAHVRLPTLSHTSDTLFYMGYGKASITTSQEDVPGTWNSDYRAVYHFRDGALGYPASTRLDSTANANNLANGASALSQVAAQIGNGLNVGNTTQVLFAADAASLRPTTAFTIEAWGLPPDFSAYRTVAGKALDNATPRRNYTLLTQITTGKLILSVTQANVPKDCLGSTAVSLVNFSHMVGTYDGSNLNVYLNGALDGTLALSGAVDSSTSDSLWVGCFDYGFIANYAWAGYIDEVRLSGVARSASWILAQYNNQKTSSTFYAVT